MQPLIRCTRRVRHPLNYLIMQPTDMDQVTTAIRTMNSILVTWYMPLHNLQHCLHRRYEAEQIGECILPKGSALPQPRSLAPTEAECAAQAAAKAGPKAFSSPMSTSHTSRRPATDSAASEKEEAKDANSGKTTTSASDEGEEKEDANATLANPFYNELNNRTLASGESCVPLGLVTLLIGHNYPAAGGRQPSWLERCLDPAPQTTLALRVMVMDRISWQRTTWLAGSICHSLCWGRLPQYIFSIPLDYRNKVLLTGAKDDDNNTNDTAAAAATARAVFGRRAEMDQGIVFDEAAQRYARPLHVAVPGLDFSLTVRDRGTTLFDPRTAIVDGFLDNESALHRLALSREVNMLGLGGSVYRQTLWCTPCMPNVGEVTEVRYGQLFRRYFGCDPMGPPVATWLIREVPRTLLFQMEGEVEDENDPNSATTYGDRSLTERVQKKAMNRYNTFRDDLRGKVYSELEGREMPR